MIRAALFDIGNVLVRFSHDRMCRQLSTVSGLDRAAIEALLFERGLMRRYDRGEVSTEEVLASLEQAARRTLDRAASKRALSDIFTPNPGMEPLVRSLRTQGVRLVTLSNTNEAHIEHITANYPVLGLFDELVLSCRVGHAKPDAAIFEAAVDAAGVPPQECFYTDDIERYVEAARGLGIDAQTFEGASTLARQLHDRGIGQSAD